MQRPYAHTCFAALLTVLTMSAKLAVAGEYTYAMAASDAGDVAVAADVTTTSGVGANNRVEGMGARYLVSQDDAPAATSRRNDETDQASPVQATLPSGSSGPASDKRASHRWQSLVPGAIK